MFGDDRLTVDGLGLGEDVLLVVIGPTGGRA